MASTFEVLQRTGQQEKPQRTVDVDSAGNNNKDFGSKEAQLNAQLPFKPRLVR